MIALKWVDKVGCNLTYFGFIVNPFLGFLIWFSMPEQDKTEKKSLAAKEATVDVPNLDV